jgi:hypothetical protein
MIDMDQDSHRAIVEAAYARLRETLEAKDVSVEGLRAAAIEALDHARIEVELDPDWVADELTRLQESAATPVMKTET